MRWLNGLIRDLDYGFRMMRDARLVFIAVTLTLAVGIGINTGIFTIINGVLLRPRTDSDPTTFARLYAQYWSQGKPREFAGKFSRRPIEPFSSGRDRLQTSRPGALTEY